MWGRKQRSLFHRLESVFSREGNRRYATSRGRPLRSVGQFTETTETRVCTGNRTVSGPAARSPGAALLTSAVLAWFPPGKTITGAPAHSQRPNLDNTTHVCPGYYMLQNLLCFKTSRKGVSKEKGWPLPSPGPLSLNSGHLSSVTG